VIKQSFISHRYWLYSLSSNYLVVIK